jgi:hypothetical protein
MERHVFGVPWPVQNHPSTETPPKRISKHFLQHMPATRKDSKPETKEWRAQILAEGAKLFIGVVNVK